jgi:DNA repair exonuclease SbcCD ATPase subunit
MNIPGAEEIAVKLNIDVTDAEKMRRSLTSAGNEAHKSFIHGDNAARGFKKTLHELSEQIPILGWALRFAISPIGATFAAVASGIGLAAKALGGFNEKLMETAKINVEAITGKRIIGDDTTRWSGGIENARGLEEYYKKRLAAMAPKRAEWQQIEAEGGANWFTDQATSAGEAFGLGRGAIADAWASKRYTEAKKNLDLMDDYQRKLDEILQKRKDLEDLEKEEKKDLEDAKKEMEKRAELEKKRAEALEKQGKEIEQQWMRQSAYDHTRAGLVERARAAVNEGYIPDVSQLAETNTPYGYIARELAAAKRGAQYSMGLANPGELTSLQADQSSAYQTLLSEGNAAYQKGDAKGLAAAYQRYGQKMQSLLGGRSTVNQSLDAILREMQNLNAKANGEGLVVQGAE